MSMSMMRKSYSELLQFETFEDRFEYLRLGGGVGYATFGNERHLNQHFYTSHIWADVRNFVIDRDRGCDLGVEGYEIYSDLLVHHVNPMTPEDIAHGEEWIVDPEYLITTKHSTHNAIHYGGVDHSPKVVLERRPNDTKLW